LASLHTHEERKPLSEVLAPQHADSGNTMTADSARGSSMTASAQPTSFEQDVELAHEEEDDGRTTSSNTSATTSSAGTGQGSVPVRTHSVAEARILRAFASPFLLGHSFKQARPTFARVCQLRLDLKPTDLDMNPETAPASHEKLIKQFDASLEAHFEAQVKADQTAASNPEKPCLTQRYLDPKAVPRIGAYRRPSDQNHDEEKDADGSDDSDRKDGYSGPNPCKHAFVQSFMQLVNKIADGQNVLPDSSTVPYDWKRAAEAILRRRMNEKSMDAPKPEEVNAVINALTRPIYSMNLVGADTSQGDTMFSLYPPPKDAPSRIRDAVGNSECIYEPVEYPFTTLTEADVAAWIEAEKEDTEKGWMPLDCAPNHAGIDFVALEQMYDALMNSPLSGALGNAVRRACQVVRRATSRNMSSESEQKLGQGNALAGHFNGVNFYAPVTNHGLPIAVINKEDVQDPSAANRTIVDAKPDPTTPRLPSLLIESVRYLRGLLILLEYPGFDDVLRLPSFNVLCRALHRASTSALKPVLCNWLANYPVDRLRRIVGVLQQYSTLCWIQQDKLDAFKYPTNLLVLIRRIATVIENAGPLRRPATEFNRAVFHLHISKAVDAVTASLPLYKLAPPPESNDMDQREESKAMTAAPPPGHPASKNAQFVAQEVPCRPWMPLRSVRFCETHIATHLAETLTEFNRMTLLTGNALKTEEFYNDAVNEDIDVKEDYRRARTSTFFSFWRRPFILDAATKSKFLQLHAQYQMQQTLQNMRPAQRLFQSDYLVLDVRRTHLIEDALLALQQQPRENLKKPLRVKFRNEEGIDQGGVRKEFFQLITAELFDPKFGMFQEISNNWWFSPNSLESDHEFKLIGMLLGLAIYNSVILNVRFPPIVYAKLLKRKITLEDVANSFPEFARGLIDLLRFDGPETGPGSIEDVYDTNFTVTQERFGEIQTIELKPNGENIPLTAMNRGEYVDLKIDWFCNQSIQKQYEKFHEGFHAVAGSDVLEAFSPEELQLLVCGSDNCDFHELERTTRYEDGYTKDSQLMKWFWEILHDLSLEDKKKFLAFCTGSDRVPISGLSEIRLVISRNGPDSNTLPTAHTCFNHLMLPDYSSKEKLQTLLHKAITHSQGFGLR